MALTTLPAYTGPITEEELQRLSALPPMMMVPMTPLTDDEKGLLSRYISWKPMEPESPIYETMDLPPITLRTRVVVDDRAPDEYSADEQRERDECQRLLIKRLHDLALQLIAGSSMQATPYEKVKP